VTDIGVLVHELQKERGLSAGLLAGVQVLQQLEQQRKITDREQENLLDSLKKFRNEHGVLLFVHAVSTNLRQL